MTIKYKNRREWARVISELSPLQVKKKNGVCGQENSWQGM